MTSTNGKWLQASSIFIFQLPACMQCVKLLQANIQPRHLQGRVDLTFRWQLAACTGGCPECMRGWVIKLILVTCTYVE
jgi:hypothetical protein